MLTWNRTPSTRRWMAFGRNESCGNCLRMAIGRPSNGAVSGGAAGAAISAGYRGLGDDPLDGAGTAPATDAAAEATVDLQCAQRLLSRCRHHDPYVVVSQDIA
jgi:hypothetical protein